MDNYIDEISNEVAKYIDTLRTKFDINQDHTIVSFKDINLIKISPSTYLFNKLSALNALDEFKENIYIIINNILLHYGYNIADLDIMIDVSNIIINYNIKTAITSLPYEQLYQILLNLNYYDIKNYCAASDLFKDVCDDEYFWYLKMVREYGEDVAKEVNKYKPERESNEDQYKYLITSNLNEALEDGRLDKLIVIDLNKLKRMYISESMIEPLFENKYNDIIKYLIDKDVIRSYPSIPEYAIGYDNLTILNKLLEYGILPDYDNVIDSLYEEYEMTLSIEKWIIDNKLMNYITTEFANALAYKGNIELLELLSSLYNIYPDVEGLIGAGETGKIEVFKWASDKSLDNLFTVRVANFAYKHLDILKWLEKEEGILPDIDGANNAAREGSPIILDWLFERGIYPNSDGIERAISVENVENVKWLLDHNILPNVIEHQGVREDNKIKILKMLASKGIYPDLNNIVVYKNRKMYRILKWLKTLPKVVFNKHTQRHMEKYGYDNIIEDIRYFLINNIPSYEFYSLFIPDRDLILNTNIIRLILPKEIYSILKYSFEGLKSNFITIINNNLFEFRKKIDKIHIDYVDVNNMITIKFLEKDLYS